jgi:GT2 family glycosyltransferase
LQPNRNGLRNLLLGEEVAAAPPVSTPSTGSARLDGHVDFYGYHAEAGAWFFCGWVAKPWGDADRPSSVTARFEHGSVSSETMLATFYYRDDIEGRGVGFILSLVSPDGDRDHLVSLELGFADFSASLRTTAAGPGLAPHNLVEWLMPLLTGGEANSNRARLQAMLRPSATEITGASAPQGFVDVYGYHTVAGGWLFCGWVSNEAEDTTWSPTVVAQFERGEVRGEGVRVNYPREDLGSRGLGTVLFISGSGSPLGGLLSITIEATDLSFHIYPGSSVQRLREQDLVSVLRGVVAGAPAGLSRDVMLSILGRQGFNGADTVGELSDRIFFEFDEAIICEPDAIVLIGWYLAKPDVVRHIRLRSGPLVSTIDLDDSLKVERPDVLSAVGAEHGFDDSRCGFIVFLPHAVDPASPPYVEIETRRGELGYRVLPSRRLGGMAATRRLLECFDVRFLDVPRAYDRVIGPAVELLNKSRLKVRPTVTAVEFGTPLADPEFSVIVPLYGRIDFVEYQMALLSAYAPNQGVEFIYLLDDPPKRREAQFLFTSIYERFRLPFRALLFDRNVGFAPTNNIGLQHARGRYVCFLNSDAFPGTDDWLERLAQRLVQNPELGVVGPLLLYEDGSIQHQGMSFRRLNEFGGWYFGHHPGKGMQLADTKGMRRCISITGACMLLHRDLAERLHGFDESYAIGDFEDSDLCLRLYRMGLACASISMSISFTLSGSPKPARRPPGG